jgi:hypothetical protein
MVSPTTLAGTAPSLALRQSSYEQEGRWAGTHLGRYQPKPRSLTFLLVVLASAAAPANAASLVTAHQELASIKPAATVARWSAGEDHAQEEERHADHRQLQLSPMGASVLARVPHLCACTDLSRALQSLMLSR